jgi:hypothetical protein
MQGFSVSHHRKKEFDRGSHGWTRIMQILLPIAFIRANRWLNFFVLRENEFCPEITGGTPVRRKGIAALTQVGGSR